MSTSTTESISIRHQPMGSGSPFDPFLARLNRTVNLAQLRPENRDSQTLPGGGIELTILYPVIGVDGHCECLGGPELVDASPQFWLGKAGQTDRRLIHTGSRFDLQAGQGVGEPLVRPKGVYPMSKVCPRGVSNRPLSRRTRILPLRRAAVTTRSEVASECGTP